MPLNKDLVKLAKAFLAKQAMLSAGVDLMPGPTLQGNSQPDSQGMIDWNSQLEQGRRMAETRERERANGSPASAKPMTAMTLPNDVSGGKSWMDQAKAMMGGPGETTGRDPAMDAGGIGDTSGGPTGMPPWMKDLQGRQQPAHAGATLPNDVSGGKSWIDQAKVMMGGAAPSQAPPPAPKPPANPAQVPSAQGALAEMQPPKAPPTPQPPKPVNPTAPQAPPGGSNGPTNPAAKATGTAPAGSGVPGPMSGLQPKAAGLNRTLVKMALARLATEKLAFSPAGTMMAVGKGLQAGAGGGVGKQVGGMLGAVGGRVVGGHVGSSMGDAKMPILGGMAGEIVGKQQGMSQGANAGAAIGNKVDQAVQGVQGLRQGAQGLWQRAQQGIQGVRQMFSRPAPAAPAE